MSYLNDLGLDTTVKRHAWLENRNYPKDLDSFTKEQIKELCIELIMLIDQMKD